ncbi:hypothetical protein LX16_1311 [Stackebrandtia albiflava]|uniref:Uncharacterized protein n=1 Tax=Stackebrandtia albiflava TaxID=406432 RepID=A0A562VCK0_9ACTN|nr:hypothetical protein [Stackebrandtia albiflava]TWJ15600.1 hypothetical protein LX16_1311 [Stackebrandtia albiflava]
MDYQINFDSRTSAAALAEVLATRYRVEPSRIYIGGSAGLGDYGGPAPTVLLSPAPAPDPRFGCLLRAGPALSRHIGGLSGVGLAEELCRELGTHALVAGGATGWTLVTSDGRTCEAVIDDDLFAEEGFVLVAVLSPMPRLPEVPVRSSHWRTGRFAR